MNSSAPALSLSVDQLKTWAQQIAEAQEAIMRLQTEISEVRRRMEAAKTLFGEDAVNNLMREAEMQVEEPASIPEAVLRILRESQVGLTSKELSDDIADGPLGEKVQRNANVVYNAVWTLEKKGLVAKHGKLVFLPETYQRIADGDLHDPRFAAGGEEGPPAAFAHIEDILRVKNGPASPAEIIEELLKIPQMAERHRKNKQYFYSVIAKMVQRRDLVKGDGHYRLPTEEEQAEGRSRPDVSDLF